MTEKTTITAMLKSIRFQNNNNGFVIGIFENKQYLDSDFSGLGNMTNPVIGTEYQLAGKWGNHPIFGRQFNFDSYKAVQPKDEDGIFKYLVRTAKWVGPAIAQQLVDTYGDQTLDVLRKDPEVVAAEISGISESKAKDIQRILIKNEAEEAVMVDLIKILNIPGLRKSLPTELIMEFGLKAADIIRQNPYVITQFHGSGFMIADRLAMHTLNIPNNSIFRVKAAINYAMKQDLNGNGSTWITRKKLMQDVKDLIGDVNNIDDGIDELLTSGEIVESPEGWLAFWEVDRDEGLIADKIMELLLMKKTKVEIKELKRIILGLDKDEASWLKDLM